MEYKKIKFPKDEGKHENIIEWWYFNGNLIDKKGNNYAFMNALFKANSKKARIPLLVVPLKYIYFSHSLLTDIKNKKVYSEVMPFVGVSNDSFSKELLYINYAQPFIKEYFNYEIVEVKEFEYKLKTTNLDLTLLSQKKPLLVGGRGFLELTGDKTYYYSLTNLETNGKIKINGKWIDVQGKSWHDRQWADVPFKKNRWTWFSLQLDNDEEILCIEYNNEKGKTSLASLCLANGKQKHFFNVLIIPNGLKWKSEKTSIEYDLGYKILIDKENELKISPILNEQEIFYFALPYWEGPIKVEGNFNGKKVKGKGFMEIVSSSITSKEVLESEIKYIAKRFLP